MYLIIFVSAVIDQIIKYLITTNLYIGEKIKIIKNFFNITYVTNDGAAWSILSGNRILFIAIAIITSIALIKYSKNKPKFERYTYSLLIGGIIGNLLDRITRGYVIDYLDFKIFGYNFPVFNLADICITISAITLLILEVRENGKNHRRN